MPTSQQHPTSPSTLTTCTATGSWPLSVVLPWRPDTVMPRSEERVIPCAAAIVTRTELSACADAVNCHASRKLHSAVTASGPDKPGSVAMKAGAIDTPLEETMGLTATWAAVGFWSVKDMA